MQSITLILLPWYFFVCWYSPRFFYVAEYTYYFGFVQAKTLPLVIAFFTVVIVFILRAPKSRLYFAVGKKKKTLIFSFFIFLPVSISRNTLAVRTARIIIKGWKPAHYFHDNYWLWEHRNFEN